MKHVDISKYSHSFSLSNKIGRTVWNVCYWLFFRPFVGSIFKKWRVTLLKVFGAQISYKSHVYSSVRIWAPWNLTLGKYSTLGPNVDCYNQGNITIGSHTIISQKTYLCASGHDINDPYFNLILQPITIGDKVWIAADVFVGPNVCIKNGAIVGARSAVFKDVAENTIVGGNPAALIKKR